MQWQWQQQARNGGMVTFGWIMDESRFSSVLLRWQHTSSYSERLRESEGDMAQEGMQCMCFTGVASGACPVVGGLTD